MNCFPIAIQSPVRDSQEIDLYAELLLPVFNLSKAVLGSLVKRPERKVLSLAQKIQAAINPQTPGVQLVEFANDGNSAVRNAVLANPAIPKQALVLLANDRDRFVSSQARAQISIAAA